MRQYKRNMERQRRSLRADHVQPPLPREVSRRWVPETTRPRLPSVRLHAARRSALRLSRARYIKGFHAPFIRGLCRPPPATLSLPQSTILQPYSRRAACSGARAPRRKQIARSTGTNQLSSSLSSTTTASAMDSSAMAYGIASSMAQIHTPGLNAALALAAVRPPPLNPARNRISGRSSRPPYRAPAAGLGDDRLRNGRPAPVVVGVGRCDQAQLVPGTHTLAAYQVGKCSKRPTRRRGDGKCQDRAETFATTPRQGTRNGNGGSHSSHDCILVQYAISMGTGGARRRCGSHRYPEWRANSRPRAGPCGGTAPRYQIGTHLQPTGWWLLPACIHCLAPEPAPIPPARCRRPRRGSRQSL